MENTQVKHVAAAACTGTPYLFTGVTAVACGSIAGPTGLGLILRRPAVHQGEVVLWPHLVLLHFIHHRLPCALQPLLEHRMILHSAGVHHSGCLSVQEWKSCKQLESQGCQLGSAAAILSNMIA